VEAHAAEALAARRGCELGVTQQPVPRELRLPLAARRLVDVAQLPTAALRRAAERRSARAESVAVRAAQAALPRGVGALPSELGALVVAAPRSVAAQAQESAPAVRPALPAWSQAPLGAGGLPPRL